MNSESAPLSLALLGTVFAASTLLSGISLPFYRSRFRQRGWVDEPGGRKQHAGSIALAGGAAVFAGMAGGLALAFAAAGGELGMLPGDQSPPRFIGTLALGVTAMFLLGWWDDVVELRAAPKLLGQLAVTTATVWAGLRLPIFEAQPWAQALASLVFLLAIINACNFLDNMNGLCAGLGLIATASLFVLGYRQGQYHVSIVAAALAGGCAGFLPWNYPNASAFLGDAGSQVIGYVAALLALAVSHGGPVPASVPGTRCWMPLVVFAVPIADLVQVMVVRWFHGQPLHVGDSNHLSHRLVQWGFSPAISVAILWGLAAVAGGIAIALTP